MAKVSSPSTGIVKRLQLRAGDVTRWFGDALPAREVSGGTHFDAFGERVGSCVGLEAMRPEVKTADWMGYSAYATLCTETCSNQRDSILQRPFSSTSVADAIGDVLARKAGEKASDAVERRVW
jgi:hypothetical protein